MNTGNFNAVSQLGVVLHSIFDFQLSIFRLLFSIFYFRFSIFIAILFSFGLVNQGYSQVNVKGFVKDKTTGEGLPGANIVLENTYISTVSDESGNFLLRIPHSHAKAGVTSSQKLKVTYVGFKPITREFQPHVDTSITFTMEAAPILGEEVNIVATRANANTPTTFSTLTSKEIQAVNLGRDLPYVLQSTPSVVTTSDAGNGIGYTGITIRGSDLTRINVTMNGIPLNDAESQGVWFVDLPDLASSTQNIQVQRGVGTSTNGPGAFGASINIQTLTEKEKPFAELNASGGSYGTLKSTFLFGSGMINDKFAFDGRASYITSNGYIDRATADLKSFALSGGYFGKSTTVKFNVMSGFEKTYQAWEGVPKDSLSTNRTYNPAGEYIDDRGNLAYYSNQTDNYNQSHYQLLFSQKAGRKINLNAALFFTKGKGYYENYKSDQAFSAYGLSDVFMGNDTVTSTNLVNQKWLNNDFYGITFSGNYVSGDKLNVTLGGAWSNYYGEHYGKVIWAQYASNGDNQRNWYFNTGEKSDFNIYLKANYQLLKKLNLFGDIQYRKVDYSILGTLDSRSPINQVHHFNFVNPKLGFTFDLNSANRFYFSFAIGNREPNRNNYEVADSTYTPLPERLNDYEFGYDLKLSNFTAGACLYYMDYKNQLVLTGKINSVGEAIMTNVPESYRTGIEIYAAANIFTWLKWNFTSTFSSNKIRNFTQYVDSYDVDWNFTGQQVNELGTTDISFSPGIIAMNALTFVPGKNLNLTVNSRYISKQYIDNTSTDDRSLDPYFIQGITIGYKVFPGFFREVGFTMNVNNLFNSKYESNAWVYPYYYDNQLLEVNGYFPQALINFMGGISIKI